MEGSSQLLKVFRKSLSKMTTFCLTLRRWEDLIRKGIARGMGRRGVLSIVPLQKWDKEGCFLLCPYRPQQILWGWIFLFPIHSSLLLFSCLHFDLCCMCSTCTTHGPLYPLDTMRPLLFNNRDTFISMHWTRLIVSVQFSITRMLANQNMSSLWNTTVWLKTLS